MAKVNKKQAIKRSSGLPSKEQILSAPENTDTVPAQIYGQDGALQSPAALTEGEFVFSIPSIVALGEGEYDKGLELLTQMHEELMAAGDQMLEEINGGGGLSGASQLG